MTHPRRNLSRRGASICRCNLQGFLYSIRRNIYEGKDEVLIGDSHSEEAASWARGEVAEGYDVVFIDGDHSLAGVRQDYETYGAMGRIVALHDVANEGTQVPEFWKEIERSEPAQFFGRLRGSPLPK
jgi:hypothetical protein